MSNAAFTPRVDHPFGDPTTWVPMLLVVLLGIAALIAFRRVAQSVHSAILRSDESLDDGLATASSVAGRGRSLPERLLAPLARLLAEAPRPDGGRWVVHGDASALYTSYLDACEDALRGHGRLGRFFIFAGHSLTGIALVLTFALIAWVLASQVPIAILGVSQPSTGHGGQAGTDAL